MSIHANRFHSTYVFFMVRNMYISAVIRFTGAGAAMPPKGSKKDKKHKAESPEPKAKKRKKHKAVAEDVAEDVAPPRLSATSSSSSVASSAANNAERAVVCES
jgi:hypothetical protein